jgi:DNA-binding transcriptional LysR family regulator
MILMRELLRRSDHIGCISRLQVQAEVRSGAIAELPIPLPQTTRPIGITRRTGWLATKAQREFLDDLRTALREDEDFAAEDIDALSRSVRSRPER